jgi:predicted Zn-dependent protease with MMP-like domain
MLERTRPRIPSAFFYHLVSEAIRIIEDSVPDALANLDIGVEDVPDVSSLWSSTIPLALSISQGAGHPAQIILYRRPIERHANSRTELRQLVVASLVEQVSAATGLSPGVLDPHNVRGD